MQSGNSGQKDGNCMFGDGGIEMHDDDDDRDASMMP
jgi:hypothetical protein